MLIPSLPTGKKTFRLAMSREPNSLSTVLPATSPRFASLPTGSRVEIASESWKISRRIGELIKSGEGGAGLVIDYGGDRHYGSSFRVSRSHSSMIPRTSTASPEFLSTASTSIPGTWADHTDERHSAITRSSTYSKNQDQPT